MTKRMSIKLELRDAELVVEILCNRASAVSRNHCGTGARLKELAEDIREQINAKTAGNAKGS
jgi:hypothetical protein